MAEPAAAKRTEEREAAAVDALFQAALRAGENRAQARAVLATVHDERPLVALLRRAVPLALLEEVAAVPPWCERPRVLARVVLHPRAGAALALRLVSTLHWRDLAEVAATMRVTASVRARAESLLRDGLTEMRLGDRMTLARLATPAVLPLLLESAEPRVVAAALENPRLREEDLVLALRSASVSRALVECAAASPRWRESYAVRLALVLQPRTPLSLALHRISGLVPRDLGRVSGDRSLLPVVRLAALRVLRGDRQ
ncbi:MAG TPA: hypothetical protein VMX54_09095 [Vicinamibacteria bacterium]|nr:hypothetical protein [Vicinamibacteria bacterium]